MDTQFQSENVKGDIVTDGG